jgi:segregation and condensation protein B
MNERDEPTAIAEPLAVATTTGAVATLDVGAELDTGGAAGFVTDRPAESAVTDAGSDADADALPVAEIATLLEALLFVSDGPVSERTLVRALEVTPRRIRAALDVLGDTMQGGGLRVQRGPDGAQLVTAPETAAAVEALLGLEGGRRLSAAAMETLAIVAYRQPVTRGQVERIRGVSSDAAVATLRTRELIAEVGRAPGPGRPTLFGTTQRFLSQFGLEHPRQLPPLPADLAPLPEDAASQLALPDEGAGDRAVEALDAPPTADLPAPPAEDAALPLVAADSPQPDALPERWSPSGFDAATLPLG